MCNYVLSPHPTGKHILDLGCGTGNLSSVIAEKLGVNGRLVGVDPDGARFALARRTFGHLKNLIFEEGSCDTLQMISVRPVLTLSFQTTFCTG